MTVLAVTGMVAWADLGLGSGLLTKLSGSLASNNDSKSRQYVSSAYGVVGFISFVLIIGLWLVGLQIDWANILGASPGRSSSNASGIALICLSLYVANIPLSLIHRVQFASQMVTRSNMWQGAGGVASLLFAIVAVHTSQPDLLIVAAASSGPMVMNVLCTIDIYARVLPHLRPTLGTFQAHQAKALIQLGVRFFVLSVVTSFALSSDNLIVARTLGSESVTELSVPARVLGAMGLLITLVNLPLWPANADAIARGDVRWVQRTTRRMMAASGSAIGLIAAGFLIFGSALLNLLSSSRVSTSTALLAALCLWWLVIAVSSPISMALNSVGALRNQLIGWLCFLMVSVPVKVLVANKLGLAWMVLSGALIYMVTVWPALQLGYRRMLRQQQDHRSPRHVTRFDHDA